MTVTDHWGEAEAVPTAPVGCVMKSPFEVFVLETVLGGGRRRAWVLRGRTEAGSDGEIPGFRNLVFTIGNPDVSRPFRDGPMWKNV